MNQFCNIMQFCIAAVGGWLGWYLGDVDGLLFALAAFMAVDYITGVMIAVIEHKLSSEIGFKGLCRKIVILMLVGIANLLDMYVIQSGCVFRTAVILFYLSNEGISLLENAGLLGLPIPEKLLEVLVQLHDKGENK